MGLGYTYQSEAIQIIGSKAETTRTAVAVTSRYVFGGTSTGIANIGGMSKIALYILYTAGAGETSNTLEMEIAVSTDRTNWSRIVNESVSSGASTLAQREFTIAQATDFGTLAYDAQSVNYTTGLVVTGAGGATGIIESDVDAGSTGTLTISNISGTYVNNEALTDSGSGSATVNGILQSITEFNLPLDVQDDWLRVSTKESGVSSAAGTIFVELINSGSR